MARARIRIVTALGGRSSALRTFIVGSLLVHAVLTAILVLIPELRRGPRIPPNAMVVDLVGAFPQTGPPRKAEPVPSRVQTPAPPKPKEDVTVDTPKKTPVVPDKPETKKPEKEPEKKPEEPPPAAATPAGEEPDEQAAPSSDTAGSAAAGGSVSALEVGDAAFAWYRAAVTNALYGSWRRPLVSGIREPLEVRVAFEIMRDGNVRGLRVEQSSGVPSLDRSALRAVADSAPLPPLPSSLSEPYLPASFVFRLFPEGY